MILISEYERIKREIRGKNKKDRIAKICHRCYGHVKRATTDKDYSHIVWLGVVIFLVEEKADPNLVNSALQIMNDNVCKVTVQAQYFQDIIKIIKEQKASENVLSYIKDSSVIGYQKALLYLGIEVAQRAGYNVPNI